MNVKLQMLPIMLTIEALTVIFAILLVETACIYLIFLIATVQISMECKTQEIIQSIWICSNQKLKCVGIG